MRKLSEQELITGLRAKDVKVFSCLIDQYSEALGNIIQKIVKSENLADEVLQDAFVKIWNSIQQYNESKGRFFTWMLNIARNHSIDMSRSKAYRNDLKNSTIDSETCEGCFESNDHESIGLTDSLSRLTSEHQTVVGLHYYQGYTHQEIAAQYGIPLGTVKTRLRSAIQHMRKHLKTDLSIYQHQYQSTNSYLS